MFSPVEPLHKSMLTSLDFQAKIFTVFVMLVLFITWCMRVKGPRMGLIQHTVVVPMYMYCTGVSSQYSEPEKI